MQKIKSITLRNFKYFRVFLALPNYKEIANSINKEIELTTI